MGVDSHCHAHFPEKVKVSTPTNCGIPETMGGLFVRDKERFVPNSRDG